ncbi:TonB-dependent receptor plug domain-containing protein [Geomonas paludis]|uniref:Ligand-gated TonB-dependent outer membrane channel n=1 Tax=Geomonas paludis TaxID=2740185 RepID=A0A6V8MTT5_9BACT|nr:TonB-dependent receptor [Geomonas paludis]GFO63510.1 ligand-gated TonB-dependent outer membrane channel [Geomonas paludis]
MRKTSPFLSVYDAVRPILLTVALCLLTVVPATCDDDLSTVELFNGGGAELVSASRSPRPASQTAENITVVTAEEIAALNAHTLPEILYSITGVQLEIIGTPGTNTNIEIQGSDFDHVLVLIDNVPINSLADNFPDLAAIPAAIIDRIEIVKGAASSSWGSALGGVINVITKMPQQDSAYGGTVSGSFGTRETVDGRIEGSGTVDRLGYYLSAGKLRSDGLRPNNQSNLDSLYGKLHYELPVRGGVTLSTLYTNKKTGILDFPNFHVNDQKHELISSLALQLPLDNRLSLDAAVRTRQSVMEMFVVSSATRNVLQRGLEDDDSTGGTLKLSWQGDWQLVVAGVDYDHVRVLLRGGQLPGEQDKSADRLGVYLNDTFSLGNFAITPSARFDWTGFGGNRFSPSFGITYALSENSLLRGYTARGYSLTSLNRGDATEKVWTSQLGFESGEIPYLWLKATLFRNDTWDVLSNEWGRVVKKRQLKQGGEFELRTVPLLNTSLGAGYTYIHATEGDDGPELSSIPRHTLKLGLHYRDPSQLQAQLTGYYIDWNAPAGKSGGVLWDLHLSKTFEYPQFGAVEIFGSLRNIFDGKQYVSDLYKNTGRWAEAGVRCHF